MIKSLKQEISDLQTRNLELEQQISNYKSDYENLRREYEVKLQVYGENAKISNLTALESNIRSPAGVKSPVQQLTSPNYEARLVDSQIKTTSADQTLGRGGDTSRSYGLADSGHSANRQSATYTQSQTFSMSGSGINQTQSNIYQAQSNVYQGQGDLSSSQTSGAGRSSTYQSTTSYQTNPNYRPGASSSIQQSGQSSQSGQSGQSGQSAQGSRYQGPTYSSSTYRGTGGTGGN